MSLNVTFAADTSIENLFLSVILPISCKVMSQRWAEDANKMAGGRLVASIAWTVG